MVKRAVAGSVWNPPLAQDWNSIGEATEVLSTLQRVLPLGYDGTPAL